MEVVLENLPRYWEGMRTTIGLTLLSFAAAFVFGTLVAASRVSPIPPLRAVAALYVEAFRNTPLAVLFVLFYFGLPQVGFRYSEFTTAVLVLSVYTAAFIAETVRSGINTVARGQAEAARSLGLTFPQVLGTIVMPQALRSVVAPLGSLFIALTKNTSVAFSISVIEISGVADRLNTDTARPIPVFIGAACAYLILTLPSGAIVGSLERRLAVRR